MLTIDGRPHIVFCYCNVILQRCNVKGCLLSNVFLTEISIDRGRMGGIGAEEEGVDA